MDGKPQVCQINMIDGNVHHTYHLNYIPFYNNIRDRDWFYTRLFVMSFGMRSLKWPITGIQFQFFIIGYLQLDTSIV